VSGDLGHIDAQGYLHVTGRAKDVIIRGSHNIDPGLVEEAFLAHPSVALCAVVGEPDAHAGEVPMAFVTLKPGPRLPPKACWPRSGRRCTSAPRPRAAWSCSTRCRSRRSARSTNLRCG
jgi:acyl-CoA synthetase (AMP-forming)/AMP-acid ligase II